MTDDKSQPEGRDSLSIAAYLAKGGVLTSPANVPARTRAELLKTMATFVDSEMAGAAGFADLINQAPGIDERAAAARIVAEKIENARRVLAVMSEFGADTARYVAHHPWTARLDRDAPVGALRSAHDMRLAVFNYPLTGWDDAVVMSLLMGHAVAVQLDDLARISYQPLAQAFRSIAAIEARHTELALAGVEALVARGAALEAAVSYWWPRVATSFGADDAERFARLAEQGLRHVPGAEQRARWQTETAAALMPLGLIPPEI